MGVSSKVVVTNAKHVNLFAVSRAISKALSPFCARVSPQRDIKSSVSTSISNFTEMLVVNFAVEHEGQKHPRTMYVFFSCQSDHPQYGNDSVSLSLGCWGQSTDILIAAAKEIAKLAGTSSEIFVMPNDCAEDAKFEQLDC